VGGLNRKAPFSLEKEQGVCGQSSHREADSRLGRDISVYESLEGGVIRLRMKIVPAKERMIILPQKLA